VRREQHIFRKCKVSLPCNMQSGDGRNLHSFQFWHVLQRWIGKGRANGSCMEEMRSLDREAKLWGQMHKVRHSRNMPTGLHVHWKWIILAIDSPSSTCTMIDVLSIAHDWMHCHLFMKDDRGYWFCIRRWWRYLCVRRHWPRNSWKGYQWRRRKWHHCCYWCDALRQQFSWRRGRGPQ